MTKPTGRPPGRPRPDEMPLTKISAMMDMATLRRFDRVAKREGYSRSAYLRLLIASAVQRGGRD